MYNICSYWWKCMSILWWIYVPQCFLSVDVEATLDDGNGLIDAPANGDFAACEDERNTEPYVGMVFETEAAARAYYNEYAGRVGFLTRIVSSRKSERDGSIVSRGLGCRNILNIQKSANVSNEGGQKRRDGCTATLLIKQENGGKWVVRKFVRDHNHPLVVPLQKKRATFDDKDKRIQELTAELRVKKRLSAAYREQLLVLAKDLESHNAHLTLKVQMINSKLSELEARSLENSNHNRPSL